ncbi:MAG: hypothetical protein ACI9WS_001908, partial [Paraglaciecola psychrophila]
LSTQKRKIAITFVSFSSEDINLHQRDRRAGPP